MIQEKVKRCLTFINLVILFIGTDLREPTENLLAVIKEFSKLA